MTHAPGSLLHALFERDLLAQQTGDAALGAALAAPDRLSFYLGLDPTGDSLHVGHLVPLMALRVLARAGHRPVVIMGGGTAMVGDPSGKSEMRPMLEAPQIAANVAKIAAQVRRLLGDVPVRVVNNADWLMGLGYVDFLRDIGRHFSVNRMLAMDAYKQRLATGLSLIEFNYQLLQAYDFLHLHRRHGVMLQLGGDDQWGNILAGVDLCRRVTGAQTFGLTVPLLTTATGAKMGKTARGAVWLDAERLSAADYYQFWIHAEDADVWRFLRIFTDLPVVELVARPIDAAGLHGLKQILAFESCALVHGREAALAAHRAAQGAFGGRAIDPALAPSSLVPREAVHGEADVATLTLGAAALAAGVPVPALLVQLGWCRSNNEARRLLAQGSVRLGDVAFVDGHATLDAAALASGPQLLRAGKRRVHRLLAGS